MMMNNIQQGTNILHLENNYLNLYNFQKNYITNLMHLMSVIYLMHPYSCFLEFITNVPIHYYIQIVVKSCNIRAMCHLAEM